jgi:hypothetical protein
MPTARLHPLPLLVVDFFVLTQVLAAGKVSDDFFMLILDSNIPRVATGAASLASGPGDVLLFNAVPGLVLAAEEKSGEPLGSDSGDSKSRAGGLKTPKTEKPDAVSPAVKTPPAAKGVKGAVTERVPESRAPVKPAAPERKLQEPEVPAEKSPSILQMLEGHETELLVAVAIALAFFVIGWICGGNYYVRRDRRRRTKLRF